MAPESPSEVVLLVASWSLLVGLAVVAVRLDERRLDPERLARAWPPHSRDAALIGLSLLGAPLFGLVALVFHFVRTRSPARWPPWRWSPVGVALGVGVAVAILAVDVAVITGLAWVMGIGEP